MAAIKNHHCAQLMWYLITTLMSRGVKCAIALEILQSCTNPFKSRQHFFFNLIATVRNQLSLFVRRPDSIKRCWFFLLCTLKRNCYANRVHKTLFVLSVMYLKRNCYANRVLRLTGFKVISWRNEQRQYINASIYQINYGYIANDTAFSFVGTFVNKTRHLTMTYC